MPARAGRLQALALDGAWLPNCREALAARTAINSLCGRTAHNCCDDIPPAELEIAYYRQNAALAEAGQTTT